MVDGYLEKVFGHSRRNASVLVFLVMSSCDNYIISQVIKKEKSSNIHSTRLIITEVYTSRMKLREESEGGGLWGGVKGG